MDAEHYFAPPQARDASVEMKRSLQRRSDSARYGVAVGILRVRVPTFTHAVRIAACADIASEAASSMRDGPTTPAPLVPGSLEGAGDSWEIIE